MNILKHWLKSNYTQEELEDMYSQNARHLHSMIKQKCTLDQFFDEHFEEMIEVKDVKNIIINIGVDQALSELLQP